MNGRHLLPQRRVDPQNGLPADPPTPKFPGAPDGVSRESARGRVWVSRRRISGVHRNATGLKGLTGRGRQPYCTCGRSHVRGKGTRDSGTPRVPPSA